MPNRLRLFGIRVLLCKTLTGKITGLDPALSSCRPLREGVKKKTIESVIMIIPGRGRGVRVC